MIFYKKFYFQSKFLCFTTCFCSFFGSLPKSECKVTTFPQTDQIFWQQIFKKFLPILPFSLSVKTLHKIQNMFYNIFLSSTLFLPSPITIFRYILSEYYTLLYNKRNDGADIADTSKISDL